MHRQERFRTILTLGLPIIGGMLSQSLLNLVDAAMVGRLGEKALAGVGIAGYANFIAISFVIGLSSAVQSMVARRCGEGRHEESARPVNWGLILAFVIALPLSWLFGSHSEFLLGLLSRDPEVLAIANGYFDYRIAGMLAVGINFSLRGWWNGTRRPLMHVRLLLMMHLLNVILSFGLIFGHFGLPALGAAGAGLGTSLALFAGCALNAVLVWRDAREHGFLRWRRGISSLGTMLRLAVPHSLQQLFFSLAVFVLFWIIGQIGTQEQAIAHVLINLALFLILPGVGLGMASTSLVSHALGRNRPGEAQQWGWDVIKAALAIICLLSLPIWLIPDLILGLFLQDPQLVAQARLPLQITGLAICLDAATLVLTQALLGAGANRQVMLVSVGGQWFFYLPLAWLVGPTLGFGLTGIWLVQLIHRSLSSLVFIGIWRRRQWADIRLG
ncbi:MATE family efflux transporter [Marinobacterium nitratireducens]|uniref:Multidrug-efflux transporter n=1 Tax=Marinobacterium nitratireducens TaxID=518897 RepID=A0A917ZEX0_9GAMM|nr:MATE family efflux transporter [Marinobacterium nitratireducens]GGO80619.1 MATE family efflux transporter [Marinobacterium nitratireducens]